MATKIVPTVHRIYRLGTFAKQEKAEASAKAARKLYGSRTTKIETRHNPSGRFYIVALTTDCNEACMGAIGDECTCRCGGKNHKKFFK